MSDIYTAPEAELTETTTEGEYGSIEKALSGDYEFDIGSVLSEAWGRVKGNKLGYFLCSLVYSVICFASLVPVFILLYQTGDSAIVQILLNLAYPLVLMPIAMGFVFIGVRIALSKPYSPSSLFVFFSKAIKIFLVYLLMSILIGIGFLLVVPGIYLAVAYSFALTLTVDKDMGVWEALETSRQAVTKRWFAIFGLLLVVYFILFLSMFTLGIALIWTMPLMGIAYGITYRNLFGVESETLARS